MTASHVRRDKAALFQWVPAPVASGGRVVISMRRRSWARSRRVDSRAFTSTKTVHQPHHRSGLSPPTSCRSPGAPWLNSPSHPITVYASHPPSPTTAQHSLPGGALPPYRGRSFTGRNASASPDAPELEFRIHFPPAKSLQTFRISSAKALASIVARSLGMTSLSSARKTVPPT